MADLSRKDLETRYELFDHFALNDQSSFYERKVAQFEKSSIQVNRIRASISLMTGFAAALAGLFTGIYFTSTGACHVNQLPPGQVDLVGNCMWLAITIDTAIILSVALPAIGGFFNTLADLYQWDKQVTLYYSAKENIIVADALSPLPEMDDNLYRASLTAYSEGTLQVMSDETAQWGQSIRTPKGIQEFVDDAKRRSDETKGTYSNQGNDTDLENTLD